MDNMMKKQPNVSDEVMAAPAARYYALLQRRLGPDTKAGRDLEQLALTESLAGLHALTFLSCGIYIEKRRPGGFNKEALLRLLTYSASLDDYAHTRRMNRALRLLHRLVWKGCAQRGEVTLADVEAQPFLPRLSC